MKEKVLKIINNYGVIPQLKYMQTEMFEFIEAVFQYEEQKRICEQCCSKLHCDKEKEHIEEEYADLLVMLEQFHAYYELDDMHISEIMHFKIDRQIDRIKKEK